MNRERLKSFILENYDSSCDMPWSKYPSYEVFRRADNKKWFAVVMDVPENRLGLNGDKIRRVVNLRCGSTLTGVFLEKDGYFPAYHMNKEYWITADYNVVSDDELKMLINVSYESAAVKKRNRRFCQD